MGVTLESLKLGLLGLVLSHYCVIFKKYRTPGNLAPNRTV